MSLRIKVMPEQEGNGYEKGWHQAVYWNDKLIGQVFRFSGNMKPNVWSAVPECTKLRPKSICANGFKTRQYAIDFLLNWRVTNG
jgi:hypothetical protein